MHKDDRIPSWKFVKWRDGSVIFTTLLVLATQILQWFWPKLPLQILAILAVLIWGVVLYFFRDPDREVVNRPGLVVGPADGVVMEIRELTEEQYLESKCIRISIFLSLFDVHTQRVPIEGKVTLVDHQAGKFLQAYKPEASQVNEYIAMALDTPYGKVLVKQISGILARRCINYAQIGDELPTGQRFGLIKFGSRVDLFLPLDAKVLVNIDDKVIGGMTPVAQFPDGGSKHAQ